jgi:hypothetical protein
VSEILQLSVESQPVKKDLEIGVKWPPASDPVSRGLAVDNSFVGAAVTKGPEYGKLKPLPGNG